MGFMHFGQPFGTRFGRSFGQGGGQTIASLYRLLDTFDTARAAGSVNGTPAEPTGQTRTVTDTNTKISIGSGLLNFATGGASADGVFYTGFARVLGRTLMITVTPSDTLGQLSFSWHRANSGTTMGDSIRFNNAAAIFINDNNANVASIDTYTATTYQLAIVLRTAGAYFFVKGGVFTKWTLFYIASTDVTATLFPAVFITNTVAVFTADNIRIPTTLYIPIPIAYDSFTRANGALGSTETVGPDAQVLAALAWAFTAGIWATSANAAVNTPTLGADVIVNGVFAADTDWTKGAGWTIAAGLATATLASSDLSQTVAPLTVGRWYQIAYTVSGYAAGTVAAVVGGVAMPSQAANATYTHTYKAATTAFLIRGNGFTGNIDNVSAKLLTTAELIASVAVSTADVIADVAVTLSGSNAALSAGLILNLDSTSNPQNFIVCYLDGRGLCSLEECVAGVFTSKIATAITYSAGAVLRVIRDGTSCRVFYNNAAVGTVQTMTANVNTKHGLFSTSPLNSLDGFTLFPRGTANEYGGLDQF